MAKPKPKSSVPLPLSRTGLQEVIGKLLLDESFRRSYDEDPKLAIENVGIALTDNEMGVLKRLNDQLNELARTAEVAELRDRLMAYADRIYFSEPPPTKPA